MGLYGVGRGTGRRLWWLWLWWRPWRSWSPACRVWWCCRCLPWVPMLGDSETVRGCALALCPCPACRCRWSAALLGLGADDRETVGRLACSRWQKRCERVLGRFRPFLGVFRVRWCILPSNPFRADLGRLTWSVMGRRQTKSGRCTPAAFVGPLAC